MFKLIITITLISFLPVIFTLNPTTIMKNPEITEKQAAELFAEIGPNEALPLVLFNITVIKGGGNPPIQKLRFPKDIQKAVTSNKRMIKGTEFTYMNLSQQIFFCPKQDSDEKCLVSQFFEESEQLRCVNEPIPIVQRNMEKELCGSGNTGTAFSTLYDICPTKTKYSLDFTEIYEFCYDENKRKSLYSFHEILQPSLLKSNLLFRERKVPYSFIETNEFNPLNFEGMSKELKNKELNSLTHPNKPSYGIQKLVPDTDFAFALWRKATYQNFNLDWQHKKLIPLWEEINEYIKSEAIRLKDFSTTVYVRTAVVEIVPTSEDDTQMYNIWIKMVTTKPYRLTPAVEGVAILMNNFIAPSNTADDSETPSNIMQQAVDKFCTKDEDDRCIPSLLTKFQNVNGKVRCCFLSNEIREVFDMQKLHPKNISILYIPGINSAPKNISRF